MEETYQIIKKDQITKNSIEKFKKVKTNSELQLKNIYACRNEERKIIKKIILIKEKFDRSSRNYQNLNSLIKRIQKKIESFYYQRKNIMKDAKTILFDFPSIYKTNYQFWKIKRIKKLNIMTNHIFGEYSEESTRFDVLYNPEGLNFSKIRNILDEKNINTCPTLEAEIMFITSEKDNLLPNQHASFELRDVIEKQHRMEIQICREKEQLLLIKRLFKELRNKRLYAFHHAFRYMVGSVEEIYKELTKCKDHPYGGDIYLALSNEENSSDLLHKKIKLYVRPPSKKYNELKHLSEGEKTVVALALIFAINNYKPSAFLFFDEADAALDKDNMNKVVAYLRRRTRNLKKSMMKTKNCLSVENCLWRHPNLPQTILVTHRGHFYDKTDAMIGISKSNKEDCTQIFTIDLGRKLIN
eukprot:gnl/TRDRNA2_/TRDRNA2_178062_c2_seq2.p2 gnl/TRDRNA2_/TRDRNA2_178062_c2~~gnl/TRDRNA2_/TRDRNA2_178062_c2_seq2.p2  ORF type:complete len:413 (+),score=13.15 gnl/TRDRNA2_/TRDRNA2_178062_c2_seq2:2536-3774(+)